MRHDGELLDKPIRTTRSLPISKASHLVGRGTPSAYFFSNVASGNPFVVVCTCLQHPSYTNPHPNNCRINRSIATKLIPGH